MKTPNIFAARDKLQLFIALCCTALSVAMVMMIVIVYVTYTKPEYPEDKVDRTLYITMAAKKFSKGGMWNGWLSSRLCDNYIRPLKSPEMMSFITQSSFFRVKDMKSTLYTTKGVDMNYWKIHSYTFLEGRPFDEAEFNAGSKVVVIDERVRGSFFPEGDALGKEIQINGLMFRVIGVIKDVKPTRREAFANCWMPYTWQTITVNEKNDLVGPFTAIILCKDKAGMQAVRDEVAEVVQRYNTSHEKLEEDGHTMQLTGPRDRLGFLIGNANEVDLSAFYLRWIIMILIVLTIPLFSLSILCFSNIKDRYSEIAVRKAFGASKMDIVREYLVENLMITLLGGLPSLLIAYAGVYHFKIKMFGWGVQDNVDASTYLTLPSWEVIVSILFVCFLISFLSGILPALRLSQKNIAVVLKGGEV